MYGTNKHNVVEYDKIRIVRAKSWKLWKMIHFYL